MNLNALVLCTDDKITRVLRRVLSDLEVGIETCSDADSAVRRLTRARFEAVVVDCVDEDVAAKVLSSVRSAPCNKRAIAVAMIDGQKAVRSAFSLGAHFVLYKPISFDRARTSFRAARALMKCERRRNVRVPVELPVTLFAGADQQRITTVDLSEGGMAVRVPHSIPRSRGVRIKFTLPDVNYVVDCPAEVAWKNPGSRCSPTSSRPGLLCSSCSRPWSVRRNRELCRLQNSSVNTELSPAIENLRAAFPSDSPCRTSTRSIGIVISALPIIVKERETE